MFEWKGFAKFWLWFCLIVNALVLVLNIVGFIGSIALGISIVYMILIVLSGIAMIVGLSLLLFKKKKLGFYIVAATAILNIVLNAVGGNLIRGIISAIISLLILFLAIRNNWNDME